MRREVRIVGPVVVVVVHGPFPRDMDGSVRVLHSIHSVRTRKGHSDSAVCEHVAVQLLFGRHCALEITLCVLHIAIALGFTVNFVRVHFDLCSAKTEGN